MSEPANRVAALNKFSLNEQGVYQALGDHRKFDYSDGEESERTLHTILRSANDLSSESEELQSQISDWPTEYHLSITRANLLRALNLQGVKRVLELGCGCGSITRYLGEQREVEIDAVEGSAIRAALAKQRCRDLDNVQISTANFNDISLPENEYDLVLFVGVTEYAGRFSEAETDQQALNELLSSAKSACKDNGAVLVAIENRLGMKYALGANEDHYAQPFVGLDHYPDSSGIRTYSRDEWVSHIKKAGFSDYRLLLPFPDYKVPTMVLSEGCDSEKVESALKDVISRDYTRAFSLGENEYRLWQSLAQGGTLAEHSNSFLWLIGNVADRLDKLCNQNIVSFEQPDLGYDLPVEHRPSPEMRPEDAKLVEHLNAQITQLESHSKNLEDKVNLMSNSVGWRVLNGVRRLFRKTTL